MFKKISCCFLATFILIVSCVIPAFADDSKSSSSETKYYEFAPNYSDYGKEHLNDIYSEKGDYHFDVNSIDSIKSDIASDISDFYKDNKNFHRLIFQNYMMIIIIILSLLIHLLALYIVMMMVKNIMLNLIKCLLMFF